MTYEVWVGCNEHCPNYCEERRRRLTTDPVEAIKSSILYRDDNHWTEIRIQPEHN